MRKIIPILLLCLLLAGCGRQAPAATEAPTAEPAEATTPEPAPVHAGDGVETLSFEAAAAKVRADSDAVYLFAANVGKGDALILRVGDWIGLIDTGKTWARGRVLRGLEAMDASRLDAVFLTHTDDDHAGGLRWLAGEASLTVDQWAASAMYTGVKAKKHPAAIVAGDGVKWLRRGDEIPLGDTGAVLKVLAPASLYEDDEDDNSLVMLLESPQGKILLTGDMESFEEAELLGFGDDLKCDVLKVANHGDGDATGAAFASACAAKVAVISTDSAEKPGTPDPGVLARLKAAGSRVVVTEDCGLGVLVALKGGEVAVHTVDFRDPPVTGLSIQEVDASDDRIVLKNDGDQPVGLGGCYLYSDKGDELYVCADASIDPGATLTVGTNSTKGDYDLLWDDKKVVNRKKEDTIWLYDSWGRVIDRKENGI